MEEVKKKSETLTRNEVIRSKAVKIGKTSGHEYWIVPSPSGGLNGYVVFSKKPVLEEDSGGILAYVPVHWGITYAEHDKKIGSVYGFDTSHCDSEQFPIRHIDWIESQIKIMLKGILKAKQVERKYLRCLTNKGKGKYVNQVSNVCPKQWQNMGTMLHMLSGKL